MGGLRPVKLGNYLSPAKVTDNRPIVAFTGAMEVAVQIVQPTMLPRSQIDRRTSVAAVAFKSYHVRTILHVSRCSLENFATLGRFPAIVAPQALAS
jgi:hypothetical protein